MADPIIKQNTSIPNISRSPVFNDKFKQNAIGGIPFRQVAAETIKRVIKPSAQEIQDHSSYLGTPVYDSFRFGSVDQNKNNYIAPNGEIVGYASIYFDEVLINVTSQKNITINSIQGVDGSTKQFISNGDYNITITGKISGTYNSSLNAGKGGWEKIRNYHPELEIRALHNICLASGSIPFECKFLNNIFYIDKMVITDYDFPQVEGGRYSQPFTISGLSDTDIQLTITEEEIKDADTLSAILGRTRDFTLG